MANENQSAESLHDKGKGKGSQTSPDFVNKGTPTKPLAKLEDTTNPEVSKSASQALRDNLSK
jgi:hypothetical protein